MRVVLDTNCFLAILPKLSLYRHIFDCYRKGYFELAVSDEVLNEYAEIFSLKMTPQISDNIIELILNQTNTIKTEIYYKWNLITLDKDDNKFCDTAVSASSDYLVTNDSHFNVLRNTLFPIINVISIKEFSDILLKKYPLR